MIKKTLLSLSIVSLLSACGGSSSDDGANKVNASSGTEYRVIDGYLVNADVCVIKTDESDCNDLGKTDSNGLIVIPESYTSGQVVVNAIAGQTSDNDGVGFIAQSYQMVADISADTPNVITPYTTLDALDADKTMVDIANDLGLDEALISGDYVASAAAEQAQVHLLARALVTQLSKQKEDNDTSELIKQATKINDYIKVDLINEGMDLDLNNIFIDKEGEIKHQRLISSLSDFLEEGELTQFSLNSSYFNDEGARAVTFSNGELDLEGNFATYTIAGNQLTTSFGSEQETDQFIYVSNDLSLSVPLADKDLTVMHKSEIDETKFWTEDDLIGETFYFVFDDSVDSKIPDPSMVTISFSESTLIMMEEGQEIKIGWSLEDGELTLKLSESGENDLVYSQYLSDNNMVLVKSVDGHGPLTLVLKDENLARNIISEWLLLNK